MVLHQARIFAITSAPTVLFLFLFNAILIPRRKWDMKRRGLLTSVASDKWEGAFGLKREVEGVKSPTFSLEAPLDLACRHAHLSPPRRLPVQSPTRSERTSNHQKRQRPRLFQAQGARQRPQADARMRVMASKLGLELELFQSPNSMQIGCPAAT